MPRDCACPDSDAKTCYFLRYPNQQELDGRDYCECPCHNNYDDNDEEKEGRLLLPVARPQGVRSLTK